MSKDDTRNLRATAIQEASVARSDRRPRPPFEGQDVALALGQSEALPLTLDAGVLPILGGNRRVEVEQPLRVLWSQRALHQSSNR